MRLPLFARKFIVDFIETSIATVLALSIAFPSTPGDLKAIGVAVGVGVIGAAVSAARRAAPGLIAWLNDLLQTGDGNDAS